MFVFAPSHPQLEVKEMKISRKVLSIKRATVTAVFTVVSGDHHQRVEVRGIGTGAKAKSAVANAVYDLFASDKLSDKHIYSVWANLQVVNVVTKSKRGPYIDRSGK